jgi:WD40-like Beta Propeller Repeat
MDARALLRRVAITLLATVGLSAPLCGPAWAAEPAPTIGEEYAIDVAGTSATLSAQLDPEGSDTTYRFEYGPTSSYGSSTPTKDAGSGSESVAVEAHAQELLASSTYHYRLVATNSGGAVEGPDKTFTTQEVGSQLTLLDGRQWEVVSPQEKHGAGIGPESYEGGVIQAREDGGALTYLATNPIDSEPEGSRAYEWSQVMAKRGSGGWSNRTINTSHEEAALPYSGVGPEYRFFSLDLSHSVIEQRAFMALAPGVTEPTPYLRDEAACEAKTSGCFTGLLTSEDTKPGASFGATRALAASSDLSHVVLTSVSPLTSDAPPEGVVGGLYEWSGGRLRFLSIEPSSEGGKAVNAALGWNDISVRNAVSHDGSRVVWQESCGSSCQGSLYMRDVAREETVRLNPEGSSTEFQDATADGSRVFLTASQSAEVNLYSCAIVELAGKLACDRSEVAKQVQRVLGISEDGKTVYFASDGALAAGAQPTRCGQEECNLYVAHFDGTEWTVRFIVALGVGDLRSWLGGSTAAKTTSRVSPNGRFLAFMSDRSLTGYDNRDAVSGEPDEEVFLYDDSAQTLTCASCNPTGARPHGIYAKGFGEWPLIDTTEIWTHRWLAGDIPGYHEIGISGPVSSQFRYLSDSGRLFFNATDALTPQDINGLADVYEYEPAGAGSCARSGGCVTLISSGNSREESAFLEASANGDDVFFLTSARLTPEDQDSAYDVYDAHVCSAGVPCLAPAVNPPPCDSGDSCKAPPTPQPPIFGQPASATFSGEGNVVTGTASVRHRSASTPAQRLARAMRSCRRAHRHSRRKLRVCERHARGKYGRTARTLTGGRVSRAAMNAYNGRGR